MRFACQRSALSGDVQIPGSKSHTIRGVAIAGMAVGESVLEAPLASADTVSAAHAVVALGAEADLRPAAWCFHGCSGHPRPVRTEIDVGNSGTTLRVVLGLASLLREGSVTVTGDEQIQRRPAGPLARSLSDLGAKVESTCGNGCAPFSVSGTLIGGQTSIEGQTSQYVTSLLLCCPLAARDSIIDVPLLNEQPYVQITLDWLASQGIEVSHEELRRFQVPGGQAYRPFRRRVPADFSSATFFLGAGALGGNRIACVGLDMGDSQPDKAVVEYVRAMGAGVSVTGDRVEVQGAGLTGVEIDMNETPDALPVMAVLGCFARGETRLRNVAHARIKETDRIAVMCTELRKMGAEIEELPDGLIVRESALCGAAVDGHGDHRVVMALAVAGLSIPGETTITTAEAAGVTFPQFHELMADIGGRICTVTGPDSA